MVVESFATFKEEESGSFELLSIFFTQGAANLPPSFVDCLVGESYDVVSVVDDWDLR